MHQKHGIPYLKDLGPIRRQAVETLGHFMTNPGWFSILLGGPRGTGKGYWIKKVFEYCQENGAGEEYKKPMIVRRADQVPADREQIKLLFKEAQMGVLVIEDIEELPEVPQQRILLEALETADGMLGLDDERHYVRMVFTTSRPINELKVGEYRLLPELWDRISQLVLELPSFGDESEKILQDFESTWVKMSFERLNAVPHLRELNEWLQEECRQFHGNFRDLDKICILWHQYRLMLYGESSEITKPIEVKVFGRMKKDFERFSKFPQQTSETTEIFQFERGQTKKAIEDRFRSAFKIWALKTYGTMQKAAKELVMSPRTMDRW